MCASLDLSKILHAQNLSSFPQGSKTYVFKYYHYSFYLGIWISMHEFVLMQCCRIDI